MSKARWPVAAPARCALGRNRSEAAQLCVRSIRWNVTQGSQMSCLQKIAMWEAARNPEGWGHAQC